MPETTMSIPLRRRSGIPVQPLITELPENNDELERNERRQSLSTVALTSEDSPISTRRISLGLTHMPAPEMKERMAQCIQLNAQNKINVKNAFALQVIDLMTCMIKKDENNMSTLQAVSTAAILDVCAKVYALRVDGTYNEVLRLGTGTDNQQEKDEKGLEVSEQENSKDTSDKQSRKKKRRIRSKLLATPKELKGNIQTCKPSLLMSRDEACTTDLLSLAILPNHAKTGYNLHPYNDVIIDTVDDTEFPNRDKGIMIPKIQPFSHLELCPALSTFEFLNREEENDVMNNEGENEHEEFEFNPDVSIPSSNEHPMCNINYFDADTEDENLEPQKQTREAVKIVDLRHLIATSPSQRSEYSFLPKRMNTHWAGPSYWKIQNMKKPIVGSSDTMETCQQKPVKKRECYEIKYTAQQKEEAKRMFSKGQAVQSKSKNTRQDWLEERTLLPTDMGYNIADANRLYLHRSLSVRTQSDDLNTTHLSDNAILYDYNNENDVSNYCTNLAGGYDTGDECNDDQNAFGDDQDIPLTYTGQNLVAAPKLANKLQIPYNTRAKRIDMLQLKKAMWKTLISSNDEENIDTQEIVKASPCNEMKETKRFSEVCKTLPLILSKTNAEALTLPITFFSLLHLANEKSLDINALPDGSDVTISGL